MLTRYNVLEGHVRRSFFVVLMTQENILSFGKIIVFRLCDWLTFQTKIKTPIWTSTSTDTNTMNCKDKYLCFYTYFSPIPMKTMLSLPFGSIFFFFAKAKINIQKYWKKNQMKKTENTLNAQVWRCIEWRDANKRL